MLNFISGAFFCFAGGALIGMVATQAGYNTIGCIVITFCVAMLFSVGTLSFKSYFEEKYGG